MRQLVCQTSGSAIAVVALSALLIWGGHSVSSSQASSPAASTPTPVPLTMSTTPSKGFTEVAKAVTPAVVNITTVTARRCRIAGAYRMNGVNGWRSCLEDRGHRSARVDSVGRKVMVSHGGIGGAGRGPASSSHQTGTF